MLLKIPISKSKSLRPFDLSNVATSENTIENSYSTIIESIDSFECSNSSKCQKRKNLSFGIESILTDPDEDASPDSIVESEEETQDDADIDMKVMKVIAYKFCHF